MERKRRRRERKIKTKEGSHSEPTNRRERGKQENVKKIKNKTKKIYINIASI